MPPFGTTRVDEGGKCGTIRVNKKPVQVAGHSLTANEILACAGYSPQTYSLFLVRGHAGASRPGGGNGRAGSAQNVQVKPAQNVEISGGLHFNAILKDVPYG